MEEMKKLGYIAGPMVAVTMSQYLLQVTSVMMVGHLGELALSSTSIAISLAGVTGLSVMMGMSSALETLCGQAYGAQQYTKVGIQTYTAIFSLLIVSIPLAIFWRYTGPLLILVGQNPLISQEAGKFITWLIPALFAYAILQPLVRYFQMQSMLLPMLASSIAALCLHIPLCWALVYKTGLGNIGAAISMGVAILEWWSYELLVLLSGLLPNPELETSVLAVCLNTIATLYAIPFGFGAGASTRVSNELGAGNPKGARVAVQAIIIMSLVETTIVSTTVFASRHVFGYIFSNEKEVVDYVTKMGALSGVARGVGWQHLAAYANLAAYYLAGIPVAALLGFRTSLRGVGLWIGILVGAIIQAVLLSVVTVCTNYEKQGIFI
ncbi:hypothetical protein M8C21_032119 [Ambrosia artemisiifolia]|uniref:MATE efflux family protein n=1 Tax=Ambrosia artemisiifolia TaxID=4212 RepID=A0AAD5C440_AMBAR|nr:hypothetical protein M8C21_032119 [Ambrosia artemisiifolia]